MDFSALSTIEGDIVSKIGPLVPLIEQVYSVANTAAPELAILFPQLAPIVAELKVVSTAIAAIQSVAPNLSANVAAAKAGAAPLLADLAAIEAAVKAAV